MLFVDTRIARQTHRVWDGARVPVGRGLWAGSAPCDPGVKAPVGDVPAATPVVWTSRIADSPRSPRECGERCSERRPGRRARSWRPTRLGAGKRARTVLRDGWRGPLALSGCRRGSHGARLQWRRSPFARSSRRPEWTRGRRSRGQGRGQRAVPPPGERLLCHSPIVRRISDYAGLWFPGKEKGSCTPGRGCLLGAGEGGRGRSAREGARRAQPRVSFKGSPALPFPPSPSPHCTCILKAPCSSGIGPGRVLRAQKLEPPGGGGSVGSPVGGLYHLPVVPRVRPAPPTHPRRGPIRRAGGRDLGSNAPLAGSRAGGRTALGDVRAWPRFCPPSRFPRGGAGPRRPAPTPPGVGGAAGAPGAGPGAGLSLPRQSLESARHCGPGRSGTPRSPVPETRGFPAAPEKAA